MPSKPPLDKQCWKWAETTSPSDITRENVRTAYRLTLPMCKLGACRRQCKGNPYCLNCIGEKVWFGKIQDTTWHDIRDPEEERRQPDMFVGLKNLGATCYVNTFLQLWFHNEKVRRGIYQWRPSEPETSEGWKPTSVCNHLQVIFGLLELSKRTYIDPSDFIHHLGLDAGQQQDAQEFSKLFLTVLEENLMQNNMPSPRNVIKEQFCGSYAYVTRCSNCQSASERLSEFYELDLNIQGHKTLNDSLKGFLQMEKLEGDNKYMCNTCNGKQNATRAIELKNLPPVLNLQLLRFVFEIKTGSKKKLSSIIQFPDILDMSGYLPGGECAVYDLSAVLIHRGPSAYSGHYVAHIRGKDSQAWYKFNDEDIEKIKGKNLQLGNEEDLELKQKKSVRTPKGFHSSKNAYMLVYTKRPEGECYTKDTGCANLSENETNFEKVLKPEESTNRPPLVCSPPAKPVVMYDTFVPNSFAPVGVSVSQNMTESKPFFVNENMQKAHEHVRTLLNNLQRKIEPVTLSKSENFENRVHPTFELNSQSVPDCSMAATSNDYPLDLSKKTTQEPVHTNTSKPTKQPEDYTLLPSYVIEYVEKDNNTFENWIIEMNEMKNKNIATGREKQETVKSVFQDLVLGNSTDTEAYEWLPMPWLSKWLAEPNEAPAINLLPFLCSHGKLCPDQSVKMKCVSQNGSNQLFNIYGGETRLCSAVALCEQCVRNKCMLIRTKLNVAEDDKFITKEMKAGVPAQKCYWIGKGSFRSWRRLAMERLGDTVVVENENENARPSLDEKNDIGSSRTSVIEGNNNENARSSTDQGNNMDGSPRTSVEEENDKHSLSTSTDEENDKENSRPSIDKENDKESSLRTSIDDFNGNAKEKLINNSETEMNDLGLNQAAGGTRELSESDTKDIKNVTNGKDDDETLQFNEDLLCEAHAGLDPDVTCRRLVPEAVWLKLKQYFPGCPEFEEGISSCEQCKSSREQKNEMKMLNKQTAAIQKAALTDLFHDRKRPFHVPEGSSVFAVSSQFLSLWRQFIRDAVHNELATVMMNRSLLCQHGGYLFLLPGENVLKSDENVTYVSKDEWNSLKQFYPPDCEIEVLCIPEDGMQQIVVIPEVCNECLQIRLNIEESETFEYESATVYVRKHQKLGTDTVNDSKKTDAYTDDPEFENKTPGNGRKRLNTGEITSNEPPEKLIRTLDYDKNVRKSQRHRRVRGEKEVNVSSKDTLKDLKVRIMKLFSVPPFDQNLYVDGRKLEPDNSSTLGDLRIAPGTVIDLIADEVEGDQIILEELHKESGIPESGFKGTNLLSSA